MYRVEGERGYPWVSLSIGSSWMASLLVTILLMALSTVLYIWYSRTSADSSPDSILGYSFAFLGTGMMIFAAVSYTKSRHSRGRAVGELNSKLKWHVCIGVTALYILFLHSFGNFNPRSGTYALYAMIAMIISGFIGRALDHFLPRMITDEVRKALTSQGDDRMESISRRLQSITGYSNQKMYGYRPGDANSLPGIPSSPNPLNSMPGIPLGPSNNSAKSKASSAKMGELPTSWDMAYLSLEETPQEVQRDSIQYRFVPDRRSELERPGALIPGAQEQMSALEDIKHAMRREARHRYVIRYWRIFHICLAWLTIGLTLWHLEYAVALLLPLVTHIQR